MIGSSKYQLSPEAQELFNYTKQIIDKSLLKHISNPCQADYIRLLTKDKGNLQLKDINIGDIVWTGKSWSELIAKWYTGKKKVYRYHFSTNTYLDMTENHRVVSYGEKREIKDAKIIDRVYSMPMEFGGKSFSIDELKEMLNIDYVSNKIMESDSNTISQYLRMLYSIMKPYRIEEYICFNVGNIRFAQDVVELLELLGMQSGIYSRNNLIIVYTNYSPIFYNKIKFDLDINNIYNNAKKFELLTREEITNVEYLGEFDVYDYTVKAIEHTVSQKGFLVSNCGEATLHSANGNCILSSMVPFFCENFDEIYNVARLAARFLVRVNMMDGIYKDEILRTQRIGLGLTGIHEFAWKFFGYGFRDLIDEPKSQDFWNCIESIRHTVENAANSYCDELGLNRPHTYTVMKPDGSIAKLFALTEGAHLPPRKFYIRWVQFQNNDPLLQEYKDNGYPVKECVSYPNVSIVGFPTKPLISTLGMGDKLILADDATPEEQYKWIMLLEKYWLGDNSNGQVSFTMKVNTDKVSLEDFRKTFLEYQSKVRCCTILPSISDEKLKTMYEYLPEEEVSAYKFNRIISKIKGSKMEYIVSDADMLCAGGACPL